MEQNGMNNIINEGGVQAMEVVSKSKGNVLLGVLGVAATAAAGIGAYIFCKNRKNKQSEEAEIVEDVESDDVDNELNGEE